ncbi:hypothetical protein G7Z17_g793 [Cylindrodendrum hubeiense]|uniref:Cation/H+ exchanger domain-containing protein n=1 Tax=Cylindrodendrum hubeiense TaxID=595255 RepID=A0A9P5HP48_9HYPO|nr:hypothetical protein G7Z17_g793 [Cylindrodendrum hubeiense]
MSITFEPLEVPGARTYYGNALPYGLQVKGATSDTPAIAESVAALREFSASGKLQELLDRHGAVLFRGFGHPSAQTFSDLVCTAEEARGYKPFEQIGLAGKRSAASKNVWTANEGSSAKRFYQHNEYARYTHFPSNIHFYSVKKAPKGGLSPIAHSANVFDKISAEIPELVKDVHERGLGMKMVFRAPGKEGTDNQFNWAGEFSFGQEFLPTDDEATKRSKVEKQVKRLTSDYKWNEDDSLELTQYIPDLPSEYGDGSPIPRKYLDKLIEVVDKEELYLSLEEGDILFMDNYQAGPHLASKQYDPVRQMSETPMDTAPSSIAAATMVEQDPAMTLRVTPQPIANSPRQDPITTLHLHERAFLNHKGQVYQADTMPTLEVTNFNIIVSLLGGWIAAFGLVSYLSKENLYLSEALISLLAGVAFSPSGVNFIRPLEYAGTGENVEAITLNFTRLVLGVQLVIAGVQLPSRYLQKEWKSLSILVGIVMALMWLTTSVLVWAFIPELPFLHALAIGACVTPTDPILSNAIVKGKFAEHNVPEKLQQIIVAESGANDGLGYPFLFLALYLIKYTGEGANPADGNAMTAMGLWFGETLAYVIVLSVVYGVVAGWAAKDLLHWAEKRDYVDKESFVVFAIALALFVLGTCGMIGSDDVLACFVAGNVFTWDDWFRLQTVNDSFHPTIDMLLNMTIFMWFGAVCPWSDFVHNQVISIYQLIPLGILVLLIRRLPWVLAAHKYIHQISDVREALFAGFFGPIGVSAIFYVYILAQFIDRSLVDGDEVRSDVKHFREISLVVVWFLAVCSVVVHGLCIPIAKVGFYAHEKVSEHLGSNSDRDSEAATQSHLSPNSPNVETPLLPKSYQSFESIRRGEAAHA